MFALDEYKIDKEIKKSFYKKNSGWKYEKEWRLVKRTKSDYLRFDQDELTGIIIGHRLSDEIKRFIIGNI